MGVACITVQLKTMAVKALEGGSNTGYITSHGINQQLTFVAVSSVYQNGVDCVICSFSQRALKKLRMVRSHLVEVVDGSKLSTSLEKNIHGGALHMRTSRVLAGSASADDVTGPLLIRGST